MGDEPIYSSLDNKPITAPGAPTGVTGTNNGTTGVMTVEWTAPTDTGGALGPPDGPSLYYSVQGSSDNGANWTNLPNGYLMEGMLTIEYSPGYFGTTYIFRVRATNRSGENFQTYTDGSYSSSDPVLNAVKPNAPSVGGTSGNTTVSLTWYTSYNGGSAITNHTVEYTPSGGSAVEVVTGSASESYVVTGLTNGTSYTFRVKATNSLGYSQYSSSSDAVTPMTIPGKPTDLTATHDGVNTYVSLAWMAPTDTGGASSSLLYVADFTSTVGAESWVRATFIGDGSSTTSTSGNISFSGTQPGDTYKFRLVAINIGVSGVGAFSDDSNSVLYAFSPYMPSAPTTTIGNAQIDLTWSSATTNGSAITNYTVEYTPSGVSPSTVSTNSTSTSYTVTGLTNGTSYTFKVKATNSIGDSLYSTASDAAIPFTEPDAPTNVVAVASSTQVALTWNAPASNGGKALVVYNIVGDTGNPSSPGYELGGIYVSGATTSYTVTGLTNGTIHTFSVRATNNSGGAPWGPYSDPSNAVTPA